MILNIISVNLMSSITPEVWWTVAAILTVIGSCVVGYFYKPSEDGPLIMLEVLIICFCTAFWPIVLIATATIGVIALPILFGMYIKKLKIKRDEEKKEKLEMMSDAERILKK